MLLRSRAPPDPSDACRRAELPSRPRQLTRLCQLQKSYRIHELFRKPMQKPEWPLRSFFNAVDSQPPQLRDYLVAREEMVTLLPKIEALSPQMHWTLLICFRVEGSKQTWLPRELFQPKPLRCATLELIFLMRPYSFPRYGSSKPRDQIDIHLETRRKGCRKEGEFGARNLRDCGNSSEQYVVASRHLVTCL